MPYRNLAQLTFGHSGQVSLGRARNVYGVVIDPETYKVDYDGTVKPRKER